MPPRAPLPWLSILAIAQIAGAQAVTLQEPWGYDNLIKLLRTPVVSASGFGQAQEDAPAKVVVIGSEELRLRGYEDLEAVLHDLAGFDFNKTMGVEWSTIYMRGFRSSNSDRFLLIWDGVIQNDIWKQSVWLSRQYPLSLVKRIEVMYGPASLLFGANAMSGIVNVILKSPEELQGISARAMAGSFGTRALEAGFGGGQGQWRYHVFFRGFRSDEADFNGKGWTDAAGRFRPYNLRFPEDLLPATDPSFNLVLQDGLPTWLHNGQRRVMNGRYENGTQDAFLSATLAYNDWTLNAYSWRNKEDQGQWYTALNKVQSPWTPTGTAIHLNHHRILGRGWTRKDFAWFRTSGIDGDDSYGLRFRTIFAGPASPRDLKLSQMDSTVFSRITNRELRVGQHYTYSGTNLEAVVGGELTATDIAEDYQIRQTDLQAWSPERRHQERNAALLGSLQKQFNARFSISAGTRFDRNYHAGEEGGFGNLLTSRIAALWSPVQGHQLKLIWAQGYQAPPAFQKFSTAPSIRDLPATNLKPERLNSWEAMYQFHPQGETQASLNLYRSQVDQFITLGTVPFGNGTTTQYRNLGGVILRGLEGELRWRKRSGLGGFLNLGIRRSEDLDTGRKVGDIAPWSANGGVDWVLSSRWSFSLRGHYVGGRDTVNWDSTSPYVVRRVSPYATWDAAVGALRLFPGLELRLSLSNLLDREYYDPGVRTADGKTYNAALMQQPIRGFLTLDYRF